MVICQAPNLGTLTNMDLDSRRLSCGSRICRGLAGNASWVVESVIDYGKGWGSHCVAIPELKDDKVWRDSRYFG